MKNFLLNLFALLGILFGLFWLLDQAFTEVYKRGDYTKTQWLYKMKNQHFDFAIHGSSRGYTTIDVGDIEKELKLNGVNLAVDGSSITDQYLMLKLFLDHHNTINQLYLQVDPVATATEEIFASSIPKFFPYIKEPSVFEHYKDFGYKWYIYRYLPFYRYAEYNTIWGVHQVLNDYFNLLPKEYDKYGGRFYPVSHYKKSDEKRRFEFDLTSNYKYLNKIIGLCQANNIKLTLFTAPYSVVDVNDKYKNNVAAFRNMVNSKGVEYVNYAAIYNHKLNLFYDNSHLNKKGAKSFTVEIKESLIKPSWQRVGFAAARYK